LKEFKKGLELFGLSNILSEHPELSRELFVIDKVQEVDANYLLALIHPEYSPECSSRRHLEEQSMDYLQDLLFSMEDDKVTAHTCPIAWKDSRDPDEDRRDDNPIAEQFITPEV